MRARKNVALRGRGRTHGTLKDLAIILIEDDRNWLRTTATG